MSKFGEATAVPAPDSTPVRVWSSTAGDSLDELRQAANSMEAETAIKYWNPMEEDFKSPTNLYNFDVEDPASAIYGYVGKEYERTCELYGKTGKCYKGIACRKRHERLDPTGFTTDEEEIYTNAFHSLDPFEADDELVVYVTAVTNAAEFYCVPAVENRAGREETLLSLVAFMNSRENVASLKKLLVPPSVGQVVVGRYSSYKLWHRGRVVDVMPETNVCTLFFVDLGNTEIVDLSDVRAIEPRYLHLPFQAIQCRLRGIEEHPKAETREVRRYFDRIRRYPCRIAVVSSFPGDRPHLLVKLYDRDGEDVAEMLLEKKYAVPKDDIIFDENETTLPG